MNSHATDHVAKRWQTGPDRPPSAATWCSEGDHPSEPGKVAPRPLLPPASGTWLPTCPRALVPSSPEPQLRASFEQPPRGGLARGDTEGRYPPVVGKIHGE